MNDNQDDDPLRALHREALPPPQLKVRVTRTLTARGLLRRPSTSRRWIGAMAAAVLLFVIGLTVGRGTTAGGPASAGPRFVLLLYQDASFEPGPTPHAHYDEYAAWAQGLRDRGKLVSGTALDSASVLLHAAAGGLEVTHNGVASAAGVVGGFFIIRAASNAEALAIAETCPHLRYGGRIVLRPVFPG